ncbi:M28 family peptidase [Saccharothrix luteola]|uniref:M28 family peptidase n=1 Tax=Saccharothrix luteola TaxID=2893018 RepID=UPI001E518160|nr:M28 family peptidase [Saccharothrix luteola]MCC8249361.1 M28 family peptidase [Saccharothrix luteola]
MRIVAFAVVFIVLAAVPAGAQPRDDRLARALSGSVSTPSALATLVEFDAAAKRHGGNRAAGTPGFERSREHVERVLRRAGYHVTAQPVPYTGFTADVEVFTAPDGARVRALMGQFTPSGQVTGALSAATGDGCQAGHYPAGTAIAVAPAGGCPTVDKAVAARAAGVRAVLFYDVSPAIDAVLRRRVPGAPLPVAFISERSARSLTPGTASLDLRGHSFDDVTVNVFAETSGGRADSVVMAGAHLDSAVDGPGVNDNGTSVAALLETAVRLAPHQARVVNKVRFAFWGAEEWLNVGSIHYVSTLAPPELAAITLYLNWELIASPNYVHFVVDGDDSDHPGTGSPPGPPGSGVVEAVLSQGYRVRDVPFRTADLNDIRSDQEPFAAVGVPVGGAFGGVRGIKTPEEAAVFGGTAGMTYDPCYHQPCDDLSSVHTGALGESMRAMAWAVGRFAVRDDDVRP